MIRYISKYFDLNSALDKLTKYSTIFQLVFQPCFVHKHLKRMSTVMKSKTPPMKA